MIDEFVSELGPREISEERLEEMLDRLELQETGAYSPASNPARNVSSCPKPVLETVSGFSRYQNTVASLPAGEQARVKNIAGLIVRSFQPGCQPIHTVRLLGHADKDLERERREPGFMLKISKERAVAV